MARSHNEAAGVDCDTQVLLAAPASSWKKKSDGQMESWHNVDGKDVKPLGDSESMVKNGTRHG